MDPRTNPYVPNAGARPLVLAGRDDLIARFEVVLARVRAGFAEQSLLPYGLRGVGKTVLLNQFRNDAASASYCIAYIEADDRVTFISRMTTELRSILFTLDANERVSAFAKRALRVFKSFSLKFGPEGLSASLGVDAERGFGDSGDLSTDLTTLLIAIGEAAREQETAVFIAVDEAQYLNEDELNALIMALHRVNQLTLPIVAVLTGLPQIIQLAGEAKSYAERIFDFHMIGALSDAEARRAITEPAQRMGVSYTPEALDELVATTGGYPFFIQEWGYEVWNVTPASPIGADAVKAAMPLVLKKLDEGFFSVRYRRAVPAERYYLRAMAELGSDTYRVRDILKVSKRTSRQFGPYRDALIKKGLIFSPEHGKLAFTVPLFDEFMRRQEPSFAARVLRSKNT